MARVVALVPDLLFGSRLVAALSAAGHEVRLCSSDSEAGEATGAADVLVVDVTGAGVDGPGLMAGLRDAGELEGKATLALYSHVDAQARAEAEGAGFDLVVPRSRMARDAAGVVDRLVAGPA